MPCIDKIAADILNSCETIPRGGFETKAWAINREDIDEITHDVTYNTLVEAITKVEETKAYTVTAVKKEMNAGFDLATDDDIPDTYLNYFSFKPYEKDAAAITNLDSMNDLVIIAELKGLKTEGCFVIYGLEKGLFKNTGTQRQNDSHGLPIYEMQSQEGQGERYSRFVFWDTDYDTSLAAIEYLEEAYGPELHDDANAASDPEGNEADATTGWTPTSLSGTGSNVFESQGAVKDVGSYSIHANSNDTPTNGAKFVKTFTVEDGENYICTFRWRHVGAGGGWRSLVNAVQVDAIASVNTDFESGSITETASGVTMVVQFEEYSETFDGGIYMDNLSFRKIL
jgi:hypothetical protein